jgi:hypothetical protein
MKKSLIIIASIISTITASAQNTDFSDYTEAFDYVFRNVSRTDATTGILYERVLPFARLQNFKSNVSSVDTSNSEHFLQAYLELDNAAFLPASKLPFHADSLENNKNNKNL